MSYENIKDVTSLQDLGDNVVKEINYGFGGKNKVILLKWEVKYDESVSNTHSAPKFKNTNWGCDPELPRGYPGWEGRVWIIYQADPRKPGFHNPLRIQRIHTGTGGYGHYSNSSKWCVALTREMYPLSWDVRFFADDFPKVKELLEPQEIELQKALNIEYPKLATHTYLYVDEQSRSEQCLTIAQKYKGTNRSR